MSIDLTSVIDQDVDHGSIKGFHLHLIMDAQVGTHDPILF